MIHLRVSIPFDRIAQFFSSLTTSHLKFEFILPQTLQTISFLQHLNGEKNPMTVDQNINASAAHIRLSMWVDRYWKGQPTLTRITYTNIRVESVHKWNWLFMISEMTETTGCSCRANKNTYIIQKEYTSNGKQMQNETMNPGKWANTHNANTSENKFEYRGIWRSMLAGN